MVVDVRFYVNQHPTFSGVETRPCSSVVLSVDPSGSSRNQISINESGVTLYYT